MISNTRVLSQQLADPQFDNPRDLVSWMGAVQAQDYAMSKWALGIRLKTATMQDIDASLRKGEILRTHIMRPTWHLVAAEDIRWMLELSGKRIKSAVRSYGKYFDWSEEMYFKCFRSIEKILEGHDGMTKQEIESELAKTGIVTDTMKMNHLLMSAEAEGIVCSGIDKGKKTTYALLDERVPSTGELHKEEALARLAGKYFQSHSPASLQDFVWWSGLPIAEARKAIHLIEADLISDRFAPRELYVHGSYGIDLTTDDNLHFLPSYDEYLISYKDRTSVLDLQHHPKAFSNNGIFHPVILYRGKIVGNWTKSIRKGQLKIETSFFDKNIRINKKQIARAEDKYFNFVR